MTTPAPSRLLKPGDYKPVPRRYQWKRSKISARRGSSMMPRRPSLAAMPTTSAAGSVKRSRTARTVVLSAASRKRCPSTPSRCAQVYSKGTPPPSWSTPYREDDAALELQTPVRRHGCAERKKVHQPAVSMLHPMRHSCTREAICGQAVLEGVEVCEVVDDNGHIRRGLASRRSSGTRAPTMANGIPSSRSPRSRSVTTGSRRGSICGTVQDPGQEQLGGLQGLFSTPIAEFSVGQQVRSHGKVVSGPIRHRQRAGRLDD